MPALTAHQITPFLHVPNLARAVALFTDVLGFVEVYTEPGYAYLEFAGHGLRILEEPARQLQLDGKARMTVYVDVPDVDALFEQLRPGLERLPQRDLERPRNKPWKQREFMVRLPDGDWVAFGQAATSA